MGYQSEAVELEEYVIFYQTKKQHFEGYHLNVCGIAETSEVEEILEEGDKLGWLDLEEDRYLSEDLIQEGDNPDHWVYDIEGVPEDIGIRAGDQTCEEIEEQLNEINFEDKLDPMISREDWEYEIGEPKNVPLP